MRSILAVIVSMLALTPLTIAASSPTPVILAAGEVLMDFSVAGEQERIPSRLAGVHGVAVFPRVVKSGLLTNDRGGRGVVLVRGRDGAWSEPVFAELGGANLGAVDETASVLVLFRSRRSLEQLFASKGRFRLDQPTEPGWLGGLSAGSPGAEVLTYARVGGRFASVSPQRAVIRPDPETNSSFRQTASDQERQIADDLSRLLGEISNPRTETASPQVSRSAPHPSNPTNFPPAKSVSPPAFPSGTSTPVGKDSVEMILGGLAAAGAGMVYRWVKRKLFKRAAMA